MLHYKICCATILFVIWKWKFLNKGLNRIRHFAIWIKLSIFKVAWKHMSLCMKSDSYRDSSTHWPPFRCLFHFWPRFHRTSCIEKASWPFWLNLFLAVAGFWSVELQQFLLYILNTFPKIRSLSEHQSPLFTLPASTEEKFWKQRSYKLAFLL